VEAAVVVLPPERIVEGLEAPLDQAPLAADDPSSHVQVAQLLVDRLRGAGLTDVVLRSYPEARHEVFNETNRDEVVADLLGWLDRVLVR